MTGLKIKHADCRMKLFSNEQHFLHHIATVSTTLFKYSDVQNCVQINLIDVRRDMLVLRTLTFEVKEKITTNADENR